MRLPEDKIKQGILHPERDVRDAAVFYFARSFNQDPSLMPLAIQAIEKYGWSEAFDVYSFLDDLVQTDETVRWLMDEMKRLGLPKNEPEGEHAIFLSSALVHADPALLQRHQAEIMAMAELNDEAKEAIGERILYQTMEPEQLWNEFETCSQAIDEAENVPSEEIEHGYRIVEALGRHRDSLGEKVLAVLYGDEDESGCGSRWFPVRLTGEMKLAAAIPFVVELLHEDDDWLYEECHRALVKIGTDAVVTELAGEYAEGAWLFRTAVAGILEDIQSELSVSTCLKLLQREEDQWIKARLLQSILMNFATEGVEPARQFLLQTPLDPDLLELRSALLTACKLMAVDFPEFAAWKADATSDEEFRQKWYEDHPMEDDEEFANEDFEGDLDSEDDGEFEGEDTDEYDEEPVLPFVRPQERVGRNDPCPCGSGKKFKKCCYGRSADAVDSLAGSEASYRPPQSKPQFPIGTVALYGPDDKKTTKIVAGVIKRDGAEPILERWVGSTVKNDPKVQRKIKEFFDGHGVRSVAAMDRNMGCPHEEGEDFPVGEDCPFCPFWKGKQGSNRRE